jgi:hypothetical protein
MRVKAVLLRGVESVPRIHWTITQHTLDLYPSRGLFPLEAGQCGKARWYLMLLNIERRTSFLTLRPALHPLIDGSAEYILTLFINGDKPPSMAQMPIDLLKAPDLVTGQSLNR